MKYVGRHLKVGAVEAAVLCGAPSLRVSQYMWWQRRDGFPLGARWRRATRRVDLTTCAACLVELDALLESGRATIRDDRQVDCGRFFARVRDDESTKPLDMSEMIGLFKEVYAGGAGVIEQISAATYDLWRSAPALHQPLDGIIGRTYGARRGSPGWLSRGEN